MSSQKINQVYRTSDYSIFKFRNDNRNVKNSNVKRLTKRMKATGWVTGSVILVNERFEILDGQHRYLAAVEAGVPIDYMIVNGAGFETIRDVNTLVHGWNIIDHLDGYVKTGHVHYQLLDRFMTNFPELRPTECMMLVKNGTGSAARDVFESGKFETKDMKKAYTWGHQIMSLKKYFPDGYNKAIFVRALVRVFMKPQFNFDDFLNRLKLRPTSLKPCGTVEQYLELIENIYNYRRRTDEKVNLRF